MASTLFCYINVEASELFKISCKMLKNERGAVKVDEETKSVNFDG